MSAQLSLIIPFYNEEENVSAVITEARSALPGVEIIAVDDGSKDRTLPFLTRKKISASSTFQRISAKAPPSTQDFSPPHVPSRQ